MSRLMLIASAILLAPSAMAQEHDHSKHQDHAAPVVQPPAEQTPATDHSGHGAHAGHVQDSGGVMIHEYQGGALGSYPEAREASGTSWIPANGGMTSHGMLHLGDWMIHGSIDGVFTSQSGPRGDDKAFVGGMLMAMNKFSLDDDGKHTVQLRGSISPDPLMGKSGYPLLLAAGETADGVNTLVDRQHPHDFFMELSASYSYAIDDRQSVFVYGGLPGEPAFGPPAFMHRPAAMANPEAPITHHWFDSTHITFGVLTAGYVNGDFKVDVSRFRGREPDQERYDIETGELDSSAIRFSWNPSDSWALQASWADVTSPEQLEPDVDVEKWSASAMFSENVGPGMLSLTGAFARKEDSEGVTLDAWLGEASWSPNETPWTIFSRVEAVETNELGFDHHGPIENVSRVTLGASYDIPLSDTVRLAIGASANQNWTSGALSPLYDGDPTGVSAFVRLKIS